mmetsp:Transcript_5679/g.12356  ORF Transcript_5679/g.12356 Transcript_5679/m.12356 type:complete len:259 (-) Transcript_5679:155-931(-)
MDPPPEAPTTFSFHPLHPLASLHTSRAKELLNKWNLDVHGRSYVFRFDQHFTQGQSQAFLNDFFNDPQVQESLPVCKGRGDWGPLGKVGAIQVERLRTSELRLDFFDRLESCGVARNGSIAKCFDVQCGEVLASDKLRLMLLDESAEEWEVFSASERKELLFHLLRRFAVGGGLNQYEEVMAPYLEMCKAVYKELLAVQKDPASGQLQVRSLVFNVMDATGSSAKLFPRNSAHNFCYISIDPLQRHVKAWYNAWFPMM